MPPVGRKRFVQTRGAAPRFHLIDIGAGRAEYVTRKIRQYPHRRYGVIDPRYRPNHVTETYTHELSHLAADLPARGITVYASNLVEALRQMKKEGAKTRYFNVDFPFIENQREAKVALRNILRLANEIPNVLQPGGKIFLLTEKESAVELYEKIAREYGLEVTKKKVSVQASRTRPKTFTMGKIMEVIPDLPYLWRVTFRYIPSEYRRPNKPF
ncbi:MAG: hypothetical protein AABY11_01030 [archaeon]